MAVRTLSTHGLVDYRATYSDLIADDWEVIDLRQLGDAAGEAAEG